MKIINARKMTCPKPVIETKKAIEKIENGVIRTDVDNETAKINLEKLATNLNCKYTSGEIEGGCFYIEIEKNENSVKSNEDNDNKGKTILIGRARLGEGNDELGEVLMKGFIYTLKEIKPLPKTIIFLNGGVEITTKGSKSIDDLIELQESGVEILSCGTCLDYYNRKDQLMVGEVSNMYTIVEKLTDDTKVVSV